MNAALRPGREDAAEYAALARAFPGPWPPLRCPLPSERVFSQLMHEITRVLDGVRAGTVPAAELLPFVYAELRALAAAKLAREQPGHTLDATALVHEAYLRIVANPARAAGGEVQFDHRGHFFAAAAEAMRRILVESARRKRAAKHGGGLDRHDADEFPIAAPELQEDLIALDEALDRFAALEPQKAELVKLRYFAGLTIEQAAEALGIGSATAKRHWAYSKAWLYRALTNP
jgi:RNA polymerase sigma factor (TIGR02999 family)